MTHWVEGKIVAKKWWTDSLFSLYIDAQVEPFEAGQFTRIGLDINGKRVARPYSFANAPTENPLEFYLITVPEGELTQALAKIEAGQPIWVQTKGAGFFVLSEIPQHAKELWMIASGTALGVFLAILKTQTPWQRFQKIVLVHASRTEDSLTHRDLILSFQEQYPNRFQYVPFVSREKSNFALTGRVTTALKEGQLEAHTKQTISPDFSHFMLCGNPEMVHEMMDILHARGLKKNLRRDPGHITIENYWKE